MVEQAGAGSADILADVAARLGASLDLTQTLDQITRSVVDRLGFGVAALNLVGPGGDLDVVTVAGPEDVRQELIGRRQSASDWHEVLEASTSTGRLHFVDGRADADYLGGLYSFVPDIAVPDDPDAWHPLDALFAPLYGADGALCGVLSVDLPDDGMRPDLQDCGLLEMFAIQAALAIDHARLYADLQRSMDEQRRVQAELQHRALHDTLTGLANRELLLDRLDQALARSRRDGRAVAVLFMDLDHFKLVNDSLGHAVGDELLVAVAGVLVEHLRDVDTAGRLGGDEFVLLLEELSGPAEAIAVAERLLIAVREPLRLGGERIRVSLSIGISLAGAASTSGELLAEADAALYRAKAAGRGRWEVFDTQMRSEALAQLALRSELTRAATEGEFLLHYQPLVSLPAGDVLGYEALLRWQHPTRGLLLPGAFLEVLEDSDSDGQVAEWVLDQACADAATWKEGFVSVNVSPRQLARPELARRVSQVLAGTGLAPERLWIEITEDRPVDSRRDIADVQRLRDLGVHVALDDFGSGYAGLTYLQRLPADVVKIDRSFVSRVVDDPVSRGIVSAVAGLAQVMDLLVVAEGVEELEQAEVLADLGITVAQGYLWGRPAPLAQTSPSAAVQRSQLVDDVEGDLRRLHASLAAASDLDQVARVAVQAGLRTVQADAGSFVLRGPEGVGHLLHSVGYDDALVARFTTIAEDSDLPAGVAMRTGAPVWLDREAVEAHPNASMRRRAPYVVSLGCVPLIDGVTVGALGLVWTRPAEVSEEVRNHLLEVARLVAERVRVLAPTPPGG